MIGEHVPNERALHSPAPPVNQPDLGEAALHGDTQVFLDERGDVARGKRVQIEDVLDRQHHGIRLIHGHPDRSEASGASGRESRDGD
jgi:hypothetical protein